MKLREKRSENDTCEQVGAGELQEKIIMSLVKLMWVKLSSKNKEKTCGMERTDRRNGNQERRRRGQL